MPLVVRALEASIDVPQARNNRRFTVGFMRSDSSQSSLQDEATKFDRDLPGLVHARERQDSQADRAVPESEAERVPMGNETGTRAKRGPFAYDSDAGKHRNVHQAHATECHRRCQRSAATDCTLIVLPSRLPTIFARWPAIGLRASTLPSRRYTDSEFTRANCAPP